MFQNKRVWWLFIATWLIVTAVLSMIAPGAKEFAEGNKNAGLPEDVASIIADKKLAEHFPQDGGCLYFQFFIKKKV